MTGLVVWHNSATNETQTWGMNGSRIERRLTALDEQGKPIFVGPPWFIVGAFEKKIFWHNSDTHETQIWFMNLDKISRRATVVDENNEPIFIAPPWHIVGVGNINAAQELGHPHQGDIVWHNENTQETQVWIMNDEGHKIARRVTILDENRQPIFVGMPWHIVGTWTRTIAWHNDETNETQIWVLNGDQIARRVTVQDENGKPIFVGPPWHTFGMTDFNADPLHHNQNGDILWYNDDTHETQIWLLNDNGDRISLRMTVQDEHGETIFVGPPWRIATCADGGLV